MTDYSPSQELRAAIARYEEAQTAADAARDALRTAAAEEMKQFDVTAKVLAGHLPWSDETLRGIAREHGVPLKRNPTVRSIKAPKRGGKTAG
jgi:hypothetical protein